MSAQIHFEPEPGSTSAVAQIGVPKPALYGAAMLVALTIGLALAARIFGFGAFAPQDGVPVESRSFTFTDASDGGILVHDAASNVLAITLEPGTGNFVRGALRALTRTRRLAGIGPAEPFDLVRYEDGRLVLHDRATEKTVTVSSFGPTQVEAFEALFTAAREKDPASAASLLRASPAASNAGSNPTTSARRAPDTPAPATNW